MSLKFNNSIKDLIPIMIVITNPILDIIFNIFREMNWPVNINQSVRMVILLYIFVTTFKSKYAKYPFILSTFFIGLNVMQSLLGYSFSIIQDVSFSFRIIYGLYILLYYYILIIEEGFFFKIWKGIQFSSRFILLGVVLSIFGLGHYGWEDSGRVFYKGFFSGQNIITICLLIYIGILLDDYFKKYNLKKLLEIVICMAIVIIIGTRAGFLGVVAQCISVLVYLLSKQLSNSAVISKKIKIAYLCIGIFIVAVTLLYVGNQIKHFQDNGYNNLISIITSNRNIMINHIINAYNQENTFLYTMFGMGYSNVSNYLASIGATYRSIETDFIGIFFYTGIFGLVSMIFVFLYPIIIVYKTRVKPFFSNISKSQYFLIFTYFLVFIQSFIAGHVLYETFTAHYFYFLIVLMLSRSKENIE